MIEEISIRDLGVIGEARLPLGPGFTALTGEAHWEVLTRARTIENLCHLVVSAQVGEHENGRRTYGHSAVLDHWGRAVSVLPTVTGFAIAAMDLEGQARIRREFPALEHRVLDRIHTTGDEA